MARIPTLEDTLLEIRQSLGLERPQTKTQESFRSLNTGLDNHMDMIKVFLSEVSAALELDEQAQADAGGNLLKWTGFHQAVEQDTWTGSASKAQVLWYLLAYSYVPALARHLAFWALDGARRGQPVDADMPGGKFWYLPEWDQRCSCIRLPVQQVMDWLFDLVGEQGKEGAFSELISGNDTFRTLQNWRLNGTTPKSAKKIDELFPDGGTILFRGTYEPSPDIAPEEIWSRVQDFLERKQINAPALADQIPMEADTIQTVLDGRAPAEQLHRLNDLLCIRYAAPSMRTIRQRLRIARMTQDGYERILETLCGKTVAPTCTDPTKNKVLQLLTLFHSVYNLTLLAEKGARTAAEADEWFDQHLAPWDKVDLLVSIAPSMQPVSADLLAERLTRVFWELSTDAPLQDLVPTQEADFEVVVTHRLTRLQRYAEENERLDALKSAKTEDQLQHLLIAEQSYWVLRQFLKNTVLQDAMWQTGMACLQKSVSTRFEMIEVLLVGMEHLMDLPAEKWPADIEARMETLLSEVSAHPASVHWQAPLQWLRAHHLLRQNDVDGALKAFKTARTACMATNFGDLRLRIADEGFATAIATYGLSEKHYGPFYRDRIRFGLLVDAIPTPQDLAPLAEEHFRAQLRRLYPGIRAKEETNERRRIHAFQSLLRVIMEDDTAGLDDWLQANAKVFRKALFGDVRRDSLTLRLLKWLDHLERLTAATPQAQSISETICNHRDAIARIVKAWPEQADMADFKGQTPLMLVADAGDTMLTRLLGQLSDVDQQDYSGRTALHAAVAGRTPACVRAILDRNPDTLRVTTEEGNTALHTAVKFGQSECVRLIVDEYPGLVNHPNAHGLTPLDLARGILDNLEASQRYMARQNRTTGSRTDFETILALLQRSTEPDTTSPAP